MISAVVLFLLTACGNMPERRGDAERAALFKSVPSDAVAVVCDRKAGELVGVLDGKDPLLKLDLGEFAGRQAVLSYIYTGEKSSMLSLPSDTTSVTRALVERAGSLGLACDENCIDGYNVLTISRPGTILADSGHYIDSQTSIFNAPLFEDAYSAAGTSDRVAFIRNQAVSRLCPKSFFDGLMPRGRLMEFLRGAACWTVIEDREKVSTYQNAEPVHYGFAASSFPTGELRAREILPADTEFALSQPAGSQEWRKARKAYLDALSVLDRYQRAVSAIKGPGNPEKWELANGIREAAVIVVPAGRLVALRADRWLESAEGLFRPEFPELLYGKAYALKAPVCVRIAEGWLLAGSENAVAAVAGLVEQHGNDRLKSCRFHIYTPEFCLTAGADRCLISHETVGVDAAADKIDGAPGNAEANGSGRNDGRVKDKKKRTDE